MSVSVSGKHVEISEAFQDHVNEGLNRLWDNHHIKPVDAQVTLSKEGSFFQCDLSAKLGKSSTLRCQGRGNEGYSSFDNALVTLTQRLRRHRKKIQDVHYHARTHDKISTFPLYVLNGSDSHQDAEHETEDNHHASIIAEVSTHVPVMSVSEAVAEMDLNDEEIYIFKNKMNNKLNIIHRRRDGHIGWIDPQLTD